MGTVEVNRRAWTSGSDWDDRAVTIEVANSRAGDPWPVGIADFMMLARLIADVATRHGFPIDDTTILTHQELWTRYGASYPTACPGDLQRRKGELLTLARQFQTGDDDMALDAKTDYEAFRDMLYRALRWDVRSRGVGASADHGSTVWDILGRIDRNAQPVTAEQVKAIADQVVKQIGTPTVSVDYAAIAKTVNDDAARRLAS